VTEPGVWRRALAEWLGTYFLVLIGPGAVMVNAYSGGELGTTGIALAFAFVVAAMIFCLGHISGAHLNPAVTVGLWSVGRFPGSDVTTYVSAQCLGATAAAFTLKGLLGSAGHQGATVPAIGIERSFALELLLSFALMLVIMGVGTDRRSRPGSAPVAIGLTVGFCALTGPLTGASMNPARSLGPALAGGGWAGHWLYWLAPLGGMIVAARVYDFMRDASSPSAFGQE
jgi:MIP family channel proteins